MKNMNNVMMMMAMMNKNTTTTATTAIDPMMMAMMMGQDDDGEGMNPMMMMAMMGGGGGTIDPMMLMAMSDGDNIDAMDMCTSSDPMLSMLVKMKVSPKIKRLLIVKHIAAKKTPITNQQRFLLQKGNFEEFFSSYELEAQLPSLPSHPVAPTDVPS
jgi:hypothetical protein